MCGNGRPGSKASGVSTGYTTWRKYILHRAALALRVNCAVIANLDAGFGQRGLQFAPGFIGIGHQPLHLVANAIEQVGDGAVERVGNRFLLQHGDADHEKLVEIGEQDGEKLDALDQRIRRVLRFLQHAPLESEQTQFAIKVQSGIVRRRRWIGRLRLENRAGHSHPQCNPTWHGLFYNPVNSLI